MQEFIYFNKDGLDFPLSETIKVTTNLKELKDSSFVVSNSSDVKAEFYAPEIDFYIKNSQDSFAKKIENAKSEIQYLIPDTYKEETSKIENDIRSNFN